MRKIGFLISHKNNEMRRALLPEDLDNVKYKEMLYFEKGYGESTGVTDEDYIKKGVNVVTREEVFNCEVLVDVKLGDGDYFDAIYEGKILVGWAHAVQGLSFASAAMKGNHTVVAWEEIFEDGRYIFYRNREIAGEAAVLHAYRYCKKMPYDTKVAIIGNGQTAKGAIRVLNGLGANVDVYGRKLENLFKKKMYEYDVIINCVMWDTNRTDRLIYKEDLKKMKKGTMIIDISCDPQLEIETSHPTTIDNPVYVVNDVIHYAVDNTPAMFPETVTKVLSKEFSRFIDEIVTGDYSEPIKSAIVIKNGHIIDENIRRFREARNLFCK